MNKNERKSDRRARTQPFCRKIGERKIESVLDIFPPPVYNRGMESKLYIFTEGGGTQGPMKNRLEEIRKTRGIRQEELAQALGVSRQTIGSLENGRYNPSIILAFKIARFFGMQIEDIFIYEEEDG